MNKEKRRPIIAGNWKMNKTAGEAGLLAGELVGALAGNDCDIVICPPYLALPIAVSKTSGTDIAVGAQNCHFEKSGAFTGEISADMLTDLGCKYVILGHSERRQYFGETDDTVNLRTAAALNAGLFAIVCVGENLAQREKGITCELLALQVKSALRAVPEQQMERVVIAYEPVWAIGTGVTATAEQAEEGCKVIRDTVKELYGFSVAQKLRIQYGGSMNAANAQELLAQPNIDGGLIGGASLKPADFAALVRAASK